MKRIRLGRTGLMVSGSGFGCIPIQRISFEKSRELLWKAYENGINFFDTARAYSDSEEKIGNALWEVRNDIIIATKINAQNREQLMEGLHTSLKNLKTDYVDLLQIHNPAQVPERGDNIYSGLQEAKSKGLARFIGLTSHKVPLAREGVESGVFDTLQYPLSLISSQEELDLIGICRNHDVGLIAMKALCGGLITNAVSAFAFLRQYDNLVPIWGIEKEEQLDQFIELEKDPPSLDSQMLESIEKDRAELAGSFCRGCGYCKPCPAGIPIPTAARMSLLLRRMRYQGFVSEEWKKKMALIEDCRDCGHCKENCPYDLDVPELLKRNLADYYNFHENLM